MPVLQRAEVVVQICERHQLMIDEALEARGVAGCVVSPSAKPKKDPKPNDLRTYDPAKAMHEAIRSKAYQLGGMRLLNGNECPICHDQESSSDDLGASAVEFSWIFLPALDVETACHRMSIPGQV